MYNILLVEDDLIQGNALKVILKAFRRAPIHVDIVRDYPSAIAHLKHSNYDIFILDILLSGGGIQAVNADPLSGFFEIDSGKGVSDQESCRPERNGIAVGRQIRALQNYRFTPIIYVTSMPGYVQEALNETGCIYYVTKPYSPDQIYAALDRALHMPLSKPPTFTFHSFWGGDISLEEKDILYISCTKQHRMSVFSVNGEYETDEYSMRELEKTLGGSFLRIHKSHLVNKSHVTNYDKTRRALTIEGKELPVGRLYKGSVDLFWGLKK